MFSSYFFYSFYIWYNWDYRIDHVLDRLGRCGFKTSPEQCNPLRRFSLIVFKLIFLIIIQLKEKWEYCWKLFGKMRGIKELSKSLFVTFRGFYHSAITPFWRHCRNDEGPGRQQTEKSVTFCLEQNSLNPSAVQLKVRAHLNFSAGKLGPYCIHVV